MVELRSKQETLYSVSDFVSDMFITDSVTDVSISDSVTDMSVSYRHARIRLGYRRVYYVCKIPVSDMSVKL